MKHRTVELLRIKSSAQPFRPRINSRRIWHFLLSLYFQTKGLGVSLDVNSYISFWTDLCWVVLIQYLTLRFYKEIVSIQGEILLFDIITAYKLAVYNQKMLRRILIRLVLQGNWIMCSKYKLRSFWVQYLIQLSWHMWSFDTSTSYNFCTSNSVLKLEMTMFMTYNCWLDKAIPNRIPRPKSSAASEVPTVGPHDWLFTFPEEVNIIAKLNSRPSWRTYI